jgi:hypothetical protein
VKYKTREDAYSYTAGKILLSQQCQSIWSFSSLLEEPTEEALIKNPVHRAATTTSFTPLVVI